MLLNSDNQNIANEPMIDKNQQASACSSCSNISFTRLFAGYDFDTGTKTFNAEKCNNCGLVRTSPLLNSEALAPYYDINYYGSPDKKFGSLIESWIIFSNNRLATKILNDINKEVRLNIAGESLRVIDIGCGRANLLKAFDRRGCTCYGVERSDFPDDSGLENITIYKQDFLDVDIPDNSLDIAVIWHVLEHLSDPASVIKKLNKVLKPGGNLIISVPNFGSLQSKISGKHWFHLDLPRHTYHFTLEVLSEILKTSGFEVRQVSTKSFDQGIYGFIQSVLNRLFPNHPNTLYSMLKKTRKRPGIFMSATQLILAGILLPVALVEYLISWFTGTGACLTVRATKPNNSSK